MNNVPGIFGLSGNSSKEEKKQLLMQTISQQQNVENARILIEKINENCFDKCVPKPGSSLSSSESTCISDCMAKYMSAWNTVSNAYIARIKTDPTST